MYKYWHNYELLKSGFCFYCISTKILFSRKVYANLIKLEVLNPYIMKKSEYNLPEELIQFKARSELEERNKSIVQRYWEGKWNERRPEILDELQTPDVIYHGTSDTINGVEEYKQAYNHYRSALHDTRVEILGLIAEGDLVMSRVVLHATQKGELGGIPPTGNEIQVSAFTVFRLVDGKITEEWEVLDQLGMMMQLGMELKMKEPNE